ncbi:hypothetical protein [Thermococcus sp.]|uniref:hypothetical protein n=1 Tax=Thermococcus sp. TaxID=35749 RepID=UPI002602B900|nr:hypothetical protein [Thermococcus sp.]
MRRLVAFMTLIMLFVSISGMVVASTFSGWVEVPGFIKIGNTTVELQDISYRDGSLLGELYTGSSFKDFVLGPGKSIYINGVNITYIRALVDGRSLALVNATFPYVFPGENVTFGNYTISLVSVSGSGAKVRISGYNTSKEFISKEFTFGHVRVSLSAYPQVFNGYIKRGDNVTVQGHTLKFVNATVENTSSGFIEKVYFSYDGRIYPIDVGDEKDIGVFHVKVKDLVGIEYADISVNLRGVSLDIETVPDEVFKLSPGQSQRVGPYLVTYDYNFGGAKISIRNPCGQVLKSGKLTLGPVSSFLYYGGVSIGLEKFSSNSTATFFALIDKSAIPNVTKVANLRIDVSTNSAKQYVPIKAKVSVKNTGTVTLSNISLKFVPEAGASVVSGGNMFIKNLKPGESKSFDVTLIPEISGNGTLGYVEASVVAPFELACGGFTVLKFRSNELYVSVSPSTMSYSLLVNAPKRVQVYHPVNISITAINTGDVSVPTNITVKVPRGVAVKPSKGFVSIGSLMVAPLKLSPGNNTTLTLQVIPYMDGVRTFEIKAVTSIGTINSTAIVLNVGSHPNNSTVTVTETKTVTESCNATSNLTAITKTETLTRTSTRTFTKTTTTTSKVPYTPLSSKALWGSVGFVLGFLFVVMLAWYQARR